MQPENWAKVVTSRVLEDGRPAAKSRPKRRWRNDLDSFEREWRLIGAERAVEDIGGDLCTIMGHNTHE